MYRTLEYDREVAISGLRIEQSVTVYTTYALGFLVSAKFYARFIFNKISLNNKIKYEINTIIYR